MIDYEKLIFYDIECFQYQSCVVFKNLKGETIKIFTNNADGLGEYFDNGVLTHIGYKGLEEFIEGQTLVGYNNYYYDDFLLYAMCKCFPQEIIKQWNDSIIQKRSTINMKKVNNCRTLDTFQQIDISKPSLKKIEGNMGKSIIESSIDFNITRKLQPKDNLETIKYCEYDVLQTVEIFKMRKEYFDTKFSIINMMEDDHLKEKAIKWNTTSITGQILAPKPGSVLKNQRFVSDEMLEIVPHDVAEMWRQLDNQYAGVSLKNFDVKKSTVNEMGNIIEFGFGGLHGAPNGVYEARNVKLLDVASMYPSILINLKGLGNKTDLYSQIKADRLELKRSGKNKVLSDAYKLILNSTYGLLNNQYSQLNNPMLAFSICIYGQISLYVLIQRLHNIGCRVFNINTDGVAFKPDVAGRYKDIVPQWEQEFKLTLEEYSYDYWIQKDVNNYIALTDSGKIHTKGADVNNYRAYEDGGRNYYFNNANTRIVQKALVDKVIYDTPISETIIKNKDNPILYQYVLQAGGTYKGTYDNQGNKLQNVNRVFAGVNTGYEIFKKRQDDGLVKFPNAPSDMILYNGDLKDFDGKLDFQWYYDLTTKVYERWRV